jgi:hypothetical protein
MSKNEFLKKVLEKKSGFLTLHHNGVKNEKIILMLLLKKIILILENNLGNFLVSL